MRGVNPIWSSQNTGSDKGFNCLNYFELKEMVGWGKIN